ncbi:helix-turn-helix domain-containing protein [Herbiconiux sp. A18JL235]|uniref:Helix-turn-helix domain-containing protein n=1 Tax=Herbiconiux sp. A18JL235 TaxID=3152363 RepID=A0AB39BCF6_9MICO
MDDTFALRLRHARDERGLSLSELARRSRIGKGTISELENGRRGARLDTLFALSTALEVPLGELIPSAGGDEPPVVAGDSVIATPLATWRSGGETIEAYRASVTTTTQHSEAHGAGVDETVTVIRGRVALGPEPLERELGPGDSLRYPGDVPHVFTALGGEAEVILLMHYPASARRERHAQ